MNIAHILPYGARFPLAKHNGRYEWALRLAKLQADAGHEVTVYCGPSTLKYPNLNFRTLLDKLGDKRETNASLFFLAFQDPAHDVFHSHFDSLHFTVNHLTERPVVATQHWFPDESVAADAMRSQSKNVHVVPVTKFMKAADEQLGIPCGNVIYHGIDLSLFVPVTNPRRERLLFVGRVAPHKGVKELVRMVLETGESLDIVGKINDADQPYWQEITPQVEGEKIRYLGPKPQTEVATLLAHAKAFVFFPPHIEAFGQTIVEAQACGTPAIVNDSGANGELVEDGVSGFVLGPKSTLIDALKKLPTIRSEDCQQSAARFDIREMYAGYDSLYQSLLDNASST